MDRRCPIPASRLTCARALGRKQTYIGQSVPLNAMRPQRPVPLRRNYSYAIRLPRPTPPLSPVNDRLTDRLGWSTHCSRWEDLARMVEGTLARLGDLALPRFPPFRPRHTLDRRRQPKSGAVGVFPESSRFGSAEVTPLMPGIDHRVFRFTCIAELCDG